MQCRDERARINCLIDDSQDGQCYFIKPNNFYGSVMHACLCVLSYVSSFCTFDVRSIGVNQIHYHVDENHTRSSLSAKWGCTTVRR